MSKYHILEDIGIQINQIRIINVEEPNAVKMNTTTLGKVAKEANFEKYSYFPPPDKIFGMNIIIDPSLPDNEVRVISVTHKESES